MRKPWLLVWLGIAACGSDTGLGTDGGGDGAVDLSVPSGDLVASDLKDPGPPDLARPDMVLPNPNAEVSCGTTSCKAPAIVCCRAQPFGQGTCVTTVAACGAQRFLCDDPSDCAAGQVCCYAQGMGASCMSPSECTSQKGQRMCLMGSHCASGEMCCGVGPSPNWYCGTQCPVSRRAYKRDIRYLDNIERRRLAEAVLGFPLATYRYRQEGESSSARLGFIIDDIAPSPAVDASGERVDLYAYTTMAVAALQEQAREIAALKEEIAKLKKQVAARPRARH